MKQHDNELDNEMDGDVSEDWSADEDLDGVSYVCEDCDYRWEEASEEEEGSVVCPMCGSINVTQL